MAEIIRELMFIGGKEVESVTGQWIQVENPSKRGEIFAEVPRAGAADVDMAVKAAAEAFKSWKLVPGIERGAIILKIAAAVEEAAGELSRLVSSENGNAIRYTKGEVFSAVGKFRYYGGLAPEIKGSVYPGPNDAFLYSRREPIGVVAAITPWNSPLALAAAKIGPALLTGNTVVLKVPSTAPIGVMRMVKIANRFLPAGVLNVITGSGNETGTLLANHPQVRKITFTGSTDVGKKLLHCAADRVIATTMELGGKNPQIVFPDSDQDYVVGGVITTVRFNRMGQSCSSGARIYIHRSIFDSFVERMVGQLKAFKLGNALDESSEIGPIVNEQQFNKVCSYIEAALKEGHAKLVCGGLPPKSGPLAEGYYVEPTVFVCQDNNTILAREEIFGPVVVCIPWDDEDEVLKMANDTPYGLVGYIWSHDAAKAMNFAHNLEAGSILINYLGMPTEGHPYGGMKISGIGREHCLEGILEDYTELKGITVAMCYPPKK
jgi:betaine-aldehyde dehydrogenase